MQMSSSTHRLTVGGSNDGEDVVDDDDDDDETTPIEGAGDAPLKTLRTASDASTST